MYASTFPDSNLGQNFEFETYNGVPDTIFYEPIENDDGTLDYTNAHLREQSWSCVIYDDLSGWDLRSMALNTSPF
jgi:hypothetical protein